MTKHLKYLSYVFRHKWFVMLYCFQMRQYRLGIMHDMSKFKPSLWFPYVNHFCGDIKKGRDKTGYYNPTKTGDEAFGYAWFLHQKVSKHHWQYWIFPQDEGGINIIEMPLKYRIEMICDWRGAGRAQGNPDVNAWYTKNGHKMTLGEETRRWIENQLKQL